MQSKIIKWLWWKRQLAAEILLLLVIFIGLFEIRYYNRFYPNIILGKESVGGKSYDEVLEKFQKTRKRIQEEGIALIFFRDGNSKEINLPLARQGLTADTVVEYFTLAEVEKTLTDAYQMGRQGPIWQRAWERLLLTVESRHFNFPNDIYKEAIQSLLSRELKKFFEEPVPAAFAVKDGEVMIVPEIIGEGINQERIARAISESLSSLSGGMLFFSAKSSAPAVTKEKLEPYLDLARALAKSIRAELSYGGYQWNLSGNTLISWLTVKEDGSVGIDSEQLVQFLDKKVGPVVYDPPQNSRFEVRNGQLVEIFKGKSGNSVSVKEIEKILNGKMKEAQYKFLAVHSSTDFKLGRQVIKVPLVIVREPPKITKETLNHYDIRELVTAVRTSFKGSSPGRKQNISIGVAKLNGRLIAPGEEFSAVEGIGLTTEEEGFVKEYVIKEKESVKEAGGGLCQIATTLFRLAINTGLPITARTNHRYVVSYYGPGLDATVYGPRKDLKFINDTGHYLLLQGRVEGEEVVFEFYGQKDNRQIAISEPKIFNRIPPPAPKYILSADLKPGEEKCTEQARFGMNAEVKYQVKYPNGKQNEQIFKSVYQPWQKVCLVGSLNQLTNL